MIRGVRDMHAARGRVRLRGWYDIVAFLTEVNNAAIAFLDADR
jgi:hypothetical protein